MFSCGDWSDNSWFCLHSSSLLYWQRGNHTTVYWSMHAIVKSMVLAIVWLPKWKKKNPLTHWCRVTHICVGNLAIIGSDNGLLPGWRQAIIWTNAGILLNGPLGINFSEIWIWIQIFSLKKIHLKMVSAKWRLFCLGLNVLRTGDITATKQRKLNSVHILWGKP